MQQLKSYLMDRWVAGSGEDSILRNPADGAAVASCCTQGLDLAAALEHARSTGGPALRALTFRQRGDLLAGLSRAIHAEREELIELSTTNTGTTRKDGKFDIDGATGTLMAYAELGRELGDQHIQHDGALEPLGRSPRFSGGHIKVPRRGVAVHINAFNFPAWGLAEKLACALLAGVPVLTKPATATALPAWRLGELMVASGLLPAGSWSLLCGPVGDLLEHVGPQDVIAFTGSAATGLQIRSHPRVLQQCVRVNVEADSLNAMVVGPDVTRGSDTWKLFIHDLVREITQKSGQKCTATRRVFLPKALLEGAGQDLQEALAEFPVGPPLEAGVRLGPLATPQRLAEVAAGIERLAQVGRVVVGEAPDPQGPGALCAPVVVVCPDPREGSPMHELEVFGPVVTLAPYGGDPAQAVELVAWGGGSLVTAVYAEDLDFLAAFLEGAAPWSGRILLGSRRILEHCTGPGLVLPNLVHGGPGRAGGGLELGGLRGLDFYLQTVAVQGARPVLERLLGFQRQASS